MKDPKPTPKSQALAGLAHVQKMIGGPEPLDEMGLVMLRGAIEHVVEKVGAIQELQRPRKKTATEAATPAA